MTVIRPNVSRVTTRYAAIGTSAWVAIRLGVDVTSGFIHVEDGAAYIIRGREQAGVTFFDGTAIADNGDGTVTIPAADHGLTDGDDIIIPVNQTTNYAGTFTLEAATDADNLVITVDYVAETPAATAYCLGYKDYHGTGDIEFDRVNALEPICWIKAVADTINVSVFAEGVL